MIQNTILTMILLVIIGCGAQNNPDKEGTKNDLDVATTATPTTVPSSIPSATPSATTPPTTTVPTIVPSSVPTVQPTAQPIVPTTSPSRLPDEILSPTIESNELPENIAISFPNTLNKTSNAEFVKDFNEVEKIQDMAFLNLSLVSQAMPKILNECAGSITCHFEADEFVVEYNEENITLEKIDFQQYSKKKKYPYVLTVTQPFKNNGLNERNDTITYKWKKSKKDIWSLYQNQDNNITLRYLVDVDSNETMSIHNKKLEESITFLVIKKANTYHLSLNHISKNSENFSSNILLEDEKVIEENENTVQLNISNENAKEGNYILLPPQTDIENLTLKNILDLTEGTFSFFNKTFQGFLYSDKFLDDLDKLTIVELLDEDKGFQLISKDSNESELSTD